MIFRFSLYLIFIFLLVSRSEANGNQYQLGSFQVSATTESVLGKQGANNFKSIIPTDHEITWELLVPQSYSPEKPAGVLVYISPNNSGAIPQGWIETMQAHNLIWISANQSGNKINTHRRISYAALAVAAVSKRYVIDKARTYISGFSGGGKVASIVASEYPQIFKGGAFICGATNFSKTKIKNIDLIQQNRYVLITGRQDFNFREVTSAYRTYKKAGIQKLELTVIPNLQHENPDGKNFSRALQFIDAGFEVKSEQLIDRIVVPMQN